MKNLKKSENIILIFIGDVCLAAFYFGFANWLANTVRYKIV